MVRARNQDIRSFHKKRLKCSVCFQVQEIWRRNCKKKETGHLKHLYCIKCKEETAHTELEEF